MIETGNLMKELADQKSDLGKLSKMDSSVIGENGSQIYNESLANTKEVGPKSELVKPWYEETVGDSDRIDDDILGSQDDKDSVNLNNKHGETTLESSVKDETGEQINDVNEIGKDGGRYQDLKDEGWGWNTNPPTEVHHMPADSSSNLERCDGPAIVMDYNDHRETASCGNSRDAQEYRDKQKELIEQGKFREAFQMDVDDLHEKFGEKYDEAIQKAEEYLDKLEQEGKYDKDI